MKDQPSPQKVRGLFGAIVIIACGVILIAVALYLSANKKFEMNVTWPFPSVTSLSTSTFSSLPPESPYLPQAPPSDQSGQITTSQSSGAPPLPTPPEILVFEATPDIIIPGESATLRWNTRGATEVIITPDLGAVALSGTKLITPRKSMTYSINARNGNHITATKAFVTVVEPISIPAISLWKTYRNNDFNFEIKYPPHMIVEDGVIQDGTRLKSLIAFFEKASDGREISSLYISMNNPGVLSLDGALSSYRDYLETHGTPKKIEKLLIHEEGALKITEEFPNGVHTEYAFYRNDLVYSLLIFPSAIPRGNLYDDMAVSFLFTQ